MRGWAVVVVMVSFGASARSGGIEAQSCNGCHGTGTQQTSIALTPATFNPGDSITVRVTIRGTGATLRRTSAMTSGWYVIWTWAMPGRWRLSAPGRRAEAVGNTMLSQCPK